MTQRTIPRIGIPLRVLAFLGLLATLWAVFQPHEVRFEISADPARVFDVAWLVNGTREDDENVTVGKAAKTYRAIGQAGDGITFIAEEYSPSGGQLRCAIYIDGELVLEHTSKDGSEGCTLITVVPYLE